MREVVQSDASEVAQEIVCAPMVIMKLLCGTKSESRPFGLILLHPRMLENICSDIRCSKMSDMMRLALIEIQWVGKAE